MRPLGKEHQVSKVVTIPNGTTTSGTLDTEGYVFIGFKFGTMTGTSMSFNVAAYSADTFVTLKDETGATVSITIASNTAVGVPSSIQARLAPWRYIQLVSGSSEGADRNISVVMRG